MDGVAHLRPLVVLGVTGSIGTQTLDVAERLGIPIAAVAARRGSPELLDVARRHPAAAVIVADPSPGEIDDVREAIGRRARFGVEALDEAAATPGTTVINGVVGSAGLRPSIAALEAGNRLGLANKESLVAGGPLVEAAVRKGGGELLPIDSEHSALWQCLVGEPAESIRRLILTASGGPFRGADRQRLESVTVADALDHPTWSMGPRITVDSATLMNKAFEVIEAHYLFGVEYDAIDVVVHPQSIVHSLVEFADGSVKAQLGDPDMRLPIQYAITHPERLAAPIESFDLTARTLEFHHPDRDTFPCLDLGYAAGHRGGIAPAVLNAADEVAVAAFLDESIPFVAIPDIVGRVLQATEDAQASDVETVLAADAEARRMAGEMIADKRR